MKHHKRLLASYGPSSEHWVGNGFPVRSMFPSERLDELSPFLMLDYAGPHTFEPSTKPRGVGEHPHRGFETVTMALQGSVEHRDSAGHQGRIDPGDVQWMTAASGVVHEEMHSREFTRQGGTFEMIQLWVNLPAAHKMDAPRYQAIHRDSIPRLDFSAQAWARVIAGSLEGTVGPARTQTPLTVADLHFAGETSLALQLPEGYTTALVLLQGDLEIDGTPLRGQAQLGLLEPQGEVLRIEAHAASRALLLCGQPLQEPIAWFGPFVMNTREELVQARQDYALGRMGHLA